MMLERCCRGLWGLMEAVVDGRGGKGENGG